MPRIDRFCGCATARTGVLIIAMIGIVVSGISILSESISLGYIRQIRDAPIDLHLAVVSDIVGHVINGIISGCLLYGANNDKYLMVMPWLIFGMIRLVIYTFGFVILFISLIVAYGWSGLGYGILLILLVSPFLAFGFYCWALVQSVYMDMRKENDQPRTPA